MMMQLSRQVVLLSLLMKKNLLLPRGMLPLILAVTAAVEYSGRRAKSWIVLKRVKSD